MNKILCFGDGYAANHIWPEWSAIIAALYNESECKNFGAVGAGNEFISSAVIQSYIQNPDAFFLVQWADNNRFDKLVEDSSWDSIINSDSTYSFNLVNLDEHQWWLSSRSQSHEIMQYHNQYIQGVQSQLRTFNTVYLLAKLLSKQAVFFSTTNLNFTSSQQYQLAEVPWVDIDMSSYARLDRFRYIEKIAIQPSPCIHMHWVEEKLLPLMPIQPEVARLQELKRRIFNEDWKAYDPDRVEKWNNLASF
jgi:hypothetical protein